MWCCSSLLRQQIFEPQSYFKKNVLFIPWDEPRSSSNEEWHEIWGQFSPEISSKSDIFSAFPVCSCFDCLPRYNVPSWLRNTYVTLRRNVLCLISSEARDCFEVFWVFYFLYTESSFSNTCLEFRCILSSFRFFLNPSDILKDIL